MEQTDSCKCHYHSIFITGFNNQIITNRSARLCDVADAGLPCTLDYIACGKNVPEKIADIVKGLTSRAEISTRLGW